MYDGQLNRENIFFCFRSRVTVRSRGRGLTVPSRVSPLILHTQAEYDAYIALIVVWILEHRHREQKHAAINGGLKSHKQVKTYVYVSQSARQK